MTKAIELTDDGLLRRMMAGDEEAFTLLYRRRHPSIFRFALHMSGNVAVAEDVTQEVFMTLIRDAKRFDPARGTLGGFLLGVARNHLRKRWEQDRRSVPLAEDADERGQTLTGPTGFVSGSGKGSTSNNGNGHGHGHGTSAFHNSHDLITSLETVGRVRQAIQTLPENYREAVVLCDLEEMSYEEAAEALDCPVGTVRSRLHRARALLLEKLREPLVSRRAAVGL
ncbi:MAG TPA: sigma-70 family RNA polymerase sigma factor [Candidatus Limnocylindria bacterium]|nr:sigma-70 family RNA polymerase sigma factor [Candidatus Limnocylindria bacterium]